MLLSNESMLSNVTIFGYPALPINHPENVYQWPGLSAQFFSNPEVIKQSSRVITYIELNMSVFVVVAVSLIYATDFVKSNKGLGEYKIGRSGTMLLTRLLATIICSLLITPIAALTVFMLVIYRFLVHLYLKHSIGEKYVGLLKGPDVLWALETNEARSAVNVLVTIEVPLQRLQKCNGDSFLHFIRKVVAKNLLAESSPFPKLLYRRGECKLGYYFWEVGNDDHTVNDYVRGFEVPENCSEIMSKSELEEIIAQYSNSPFPFGDTATWEILVGHKPLSILDGATLYPIIFRVHHSVGDGVALLRLLLEGLADKGMTENMTSKEKQRSWSHSHKDGVEPDNKNQDRSTTTIEDSNALNILSRNISNKQRPSENDAVNVLNDKNDFKPTTNDVTVNIKKSMLLRLRNSFKLLRPTTTELQQKRASISATPQAKRRNNLCALRLLTRSTSSIRDVGLSAHFRNTEQSTGVSINLSSNGTAAAQKNPQVINGDKCLQAMKFDSERDLSRSHGNLKLDEAVIDCTFEKCRPKVRQNQKTTRYEAVTGNDESPKPIAKDLTQIILGFSIRDVALNVIIAVIASFACIKNVIDATFTKAITAIDKAVTFACVIPQMLYDQAFGKSEDTILYGKPLSGKKVISWITEPESFEAEKLIKFKIKRIREKLGGGLKFSDILMVCLSRSLEKHYSRCGGPIPSFVKVVLPARVNYVDLGRGLETTAVYETSQFTAKVTRLYDSRRIMKAPFKWQNISINSSTDSDNEEKKQEKAEALHATLTSPCKIKHTAELENKFTVALLKLPIDTASKISRGEKEDLRFIQSVQEQCSLLRNAPNYLVNYWLLRWVAHLFPSFLVKPFLSGGPCTLVLSNLPGPEDPVYLSGRHIRDIMFWIPNRGLNGLGIGMLRYCGRFSMGIIADEALISKNEDANGIIRGIFDEIERLYKNTEDMQM